MMPELKPCPCCSGDGMNVSGEEGKWVECFKCGLKTRPYEWASSAQANWNLRAARPDEGDSLREAVGNDAIYKPQRPWLKLPENENWPPKRACSAKEAVYWYLDWVKRHTQETAEQGITGPEWALKHGDPYQVLEHLIDDMMRLATTSALAVKDGGHA